MNRVDDKRYPNTVCQVVMQGPTRPSWKNPEVLIPVRNRCQFSWFCDGKNDDIPPQDEELYELLLAMSFKLYHYKFQDFTDGATHYHADYVFPEWRFTKTRTIEIEDHIFYRWEK
jgi:spore germination cell wall hydrolase CwlJ-like protein